MRASYETLARIATQNGPQPFKDNSISPYNQTWALSTAVSAADS